MIISDHTDDKRFFQNKQREDIINQLNGDSKDLKNALKEWLEVGA